MNKQSKFPAALAPLSSDTAGVVRSPAAAPATFRFREAPCEHCDWPIYTSCACECEGRGLVDCACADCGNVLALNDEGLCQRCDDASNLPLAAFNEKWRPTLLNPVRTASGVVL